MHLYKYENITMTCTNLNLCAVLINTITRRNIYNIYHTYLTEFPTFCKSTIILHKLFYNPLKVSVRTNITYSVNNIKKIQFLYFYSFGILCTNKFHKNLTFEYKYR